MVKRQECREWTLQQVKQQVHIHIVRRIQQCKLQIGEGNAQPLLPDQRAHGDMVITVVSSQSRTDELQKTEYTRGDNKCRRQLPQAEKLPMTGVEICRLRHSSRGYAHMGGQAIVLHDGLKCFEDLALLRLPMEPPLSAHRALV